MTVDVMRCTVVREKQISYVEHAVEEPAKVYELLKNLGIEDAAEEYFYLICLNAKCEVLGVHEVSHGALSETIVSPREVFKRALVNNAASIVVAHNHPSGDPTPSGEDITTTKRLEEAGNVLGVKLMDHIIVGDGCYESMRSLGCID